MKALRGGSAIFAEPGNATIIMDSVFGTECGLFDPGWNGDMEKSSVTSAQSQGAATEGAHSHDSSLEDKLMDAKGSIEERLASQHERVDDRIQTVLYLHKAAFVTFLLYYGWSIYAFVSFYFLRAEPVQGDLSGVFRGVFAAVFLSLWLVTIVARTHGTLLGAVEPVGLTFLFLAILYATSLHGFWFPAALFVTGFVYTLFRNDNRKRTFVVLFCAIGTAIGLCLPATWDHPFSYGVLGGIGAGMVTAFLIRFASTYRSGSVLFGGRWLEQWSTYEEVKDQLDTYDVILESESNYAPSRITTFFSRSAWTHTGMVMKNPSDKVKRRYGLLTIDEARQQIDVLREELDARRRAVRESEAAVTQGEQTFAEQDGRAKEMALKDLVALKEAHDRAVEASREVEGRLLDAEDDAEDELFIFEAVRPVVALTPLKRWMRAKEKHMSHKVIAFRKLKMYEGRAKVVLDAQALEDTMVELHGVPFALTPMSMIRANYQLNKERFTDSVFCSELIAEIYQRVGLMSEKRLSSNYTPRDFSSEANTRLLLNCRLEQEHRLRQCLHPEQLR